MPGQLGPRVTIGRLRQRVQIQTPAAVADSFGQMLPTWVNSDTVRAEVVPVNGRELFASGGVQAAVSHRVRIRYRAGLTAACRLQWLDAGIVLNIVAVLPTIGTANLLDVWCLVEG